MSRLPVVAIIGRPNTGKSTLFNALVGERRAIVSDTPGTTRDPVAGMVETESVDYLLLDTGGIGGGSEDKSFESDVEKQSKLAIESADVILFTLNARDELTSSDRTIVDILRRNRKRHVPVIIVATKCDKPGTEETAIPMFAGLSIADDVIATSAVHRQGIGTLEDAIASHLAKLHFKKESIRQQNEERETRNESTINVPRVAVIGKPNVGKSSLLNALMPDPMRKTAGRIVSPIPGTTRDSSDTTITSQGREYVFVDTAGLRRKSRVHKDLEGIAVLQSIKAMQSSEVVLLMLDATEPVSHQDKHIAGMACDEGKAMIIVLNKMDLLNAAQKKERIDEVRGALPFCKFAPLLPVSAVTREGLLKLFPLIDSVQRNRLRRISVKDLRDWYRTAVRTVPAKMLATSKHITQGSDPPPTFVLFVKNPRDVQPSQLRALDNNLRRTFGFEGTPIRWIMRRSTQKAKHDREE
ncbi:ribosome biogenesis GTPase Der [Candidatus Peregrinibacteria bacterium]|nr:ribosome biogenesis GTPase Der [Candidatus Peregrinibacteria bacterium]